MQKIVVYASPEEHYKVVGGVADQVYGKVSVLTTTALNSKRCPDLLIAQSRQVIHDWKPMLAVTALTYLEKELARKGLDNPRKIKGFIFAAAGTRQGEMDWGDMATKVRLSR